MTRRIWSSLATLLPLLVLLVAADEPASQPDEAPEAPGIATARAVVSASRELVREGKQRVAQQKLKTTLAELRELAGAEEAQADVLGQLGVVYTQSGKETEAIGAFESAADLLHGKFGPSDPRVSIAADRLADAHAKAGEHAIAVKLYKKLLVQMRGGLGVGHPGYKMTLGKLGSSASSAGKHKAAAAAYGELVELLLQAPKAAQGEAGFELARVRVQLATSLARSGALDAALDAATLARKAFDAGEVEGADDMEHAFSVNAVAGILEKLGRDDEAVGTMAAALEMARARRHADDPLVRQAEKNLAGLKSLVARKQRTRTREEL